MPMPCAFHGTLVRFPHSALSVAWFCLRFFSSIGWFPRPEILSLNRKTRRHCGLSSVKCPHVGRNLEPVGHGFLRWQKRERSVCWVRPLVWGSRFTHNMEIHPARRWPVEACKGSMTEPSSHLQAAQSQLQPKGLLMRTDPDRPEIKHPQSGRMVSQNTMESAGTGGGAWSTIIQKC